MDTPYDWTIREAQNWPPPGRPTTPFGPTRLDVLRACALKACFEVSSGRYERKLDWAAHVGLAFHRTVEFLAQHPPLGLSSADAADYGLARFDQELARERSEKARRPRENPLLEEGSRVEKAQDAVIVEAQRLASLPVFDNQAATTNTNRGQPSVQVEVEVSSKDGVFTGRIDRAERQPDGLHLIDFKSAVRDDVPERYQRQLQLYAYLWHETYDEWPVAAWLVYPLTGTEYPVPVDPARCEQVAADFRALLTDFDREHRPDRLGQPGEICKICDFRPWCKPFWGWRAAETDRYQAIERATWGFESLVNSIKLVNDYWHVDLKWRNVAVKLAVTQARYPHLANLRPGQRLRAIDMRLNGNPTQLRALVRESTELFILES